MEKSKVKLKAFRYEMTEDQSQFVPVIRWEIIDNVSGNYICTARSQLVAQILVDILNSLEEVPEGLI